VTEGVPAGPQPRDETAPAGQGGLAECRSAVVRRLISGLAVALTLMAISWALDVPYYLGVAILTEQVIATALGLGLALAFLYYGADGKPRRVLPWYDAVAAALGFAGGMFIAIRFPSIINELAEPPLRNIVVGVILLLLLIEGLRRTAGLFLVAVMLIFVAYAFFGSIMPAPLKGREIPFGHVIGFLTMEQGLLASPLLIASTVVVMYIFFGNLLFASGGSGYFTDLSTALVGRYRGGSAKIAVGASALFGSISGSAVSNVVTTGVITIPLMARGGYTRRHAGAIEAVASTGGQIMPPVMGAAAFVMAEFLGIGYGEVAIAALLPATLYFVALFVQADLEAGRRGIGRVDEALIPKAGRVLAEGWFFPLPFAVLVGGLFLLNQPPDLAALYAAATLAVLAAAFGFRGRRLRLGDLGAALRGTGLVAIEIILITAAAGVIMGILNLTGLGFNIPYAFTKMGIADGATLAVIAAVICIVLGMGMPTLAIYVLLAGLIAPALVKAGIEPIAAHLFVLYFGVMSMVTPPVAIAAFAAATLARSEPMATGFAAMRFGWPAYIVPFLFLWSPGLLLRGDALDVAIIVVTAIAGVFLVCVASTGFLTRRLGAPARLLFAASGVALLLPHRMFEHADLVNLAGAGVGAGLIANEVLAKRRWAQA
jgi:TRAP transporter 4TM/12TM fusion protein